ncbi:hypothetical protein M9458_029559, partial [Cirrhinus mrigala]
NKNKIKKKEIHSFCPVLHCGMAFTTLKLWVKESAEREDFKASHLIMVSLHRQGQIEVDNLR